MKNSVIWICAVVLAISQPASAQPGEGPPESTLIPRGPMPEGVFSGLLSVLEAAFSDAHAPAAGNGAGAGARGSLRSTQSARSNNVMAWQSLRSAPWPDYTRLIRMGTGSGREGDSGTDAKWVWEAPDHGFVELRPDLSEQTVSEFQRRTLTPVPFSKELAMIAGQSRTTGLGSMQGGGGLNADPPGRKRVRPSSFTDLVHLAYAAAMLGHSNEAAGLFRRALQLNGQGLARMVEDHSEFALAEGRRRLEAGRPRSEVLEQWEVAWHLSPPGPRRLELADYCEQLRQQIAEFGALAASEIESPGKLPAAQRAAYCLDRFQDIRPPVGAPANPGYRPRAVFPGTLEQELVQIGLAGVPALLEHLDDRRLSRTVEPDARGVNGPDRRIPLPQVWRVQDHALLCLETILQLSLRPPATSGHVRPLLSAEPAESRAAAVADIRDWWRQYGNRPLAEARLARMNTLSIAERITQLNRIGVAAADGVDVVSLLKSWAIEASADDLCALAMALAERGDLSLLPLLRQVAEEGRYNCEQLLLDHGEASDVVRAYWRQRQNRSGLEDDIHGENPVLHHVLRQTDDKPSPHRKAFTNRIWLAPLLIEGLQHRDLRPPRVVDGKTLRTCFADDCWLRLERLTGHEAGARLTDPPEARFAAMDRWLAWWNSEGAAAFIARHPQARPLLDLAASAPKVAAAELPPVVTVGGAGSGSLQYRMSRAEALALVARGDVEAGRVQGQPALRFATAAAAVRWFDQARPENTSAVDATNNPLFRLGPASLRGPVPGLDGTVWLSQPEVSRGWAEVRAQVEAAVADPGRGLKTIEGAEVVLMDTRRRLWLVRSSETLATLHGYDPATRSWTERHGGQPTMAQRSRTSKGMLPAGWESRGGALFFAASGELHVLEGEQWTVWPCPDRWPDQRILLGGRAREGLVIAEADPGSVLFWTRPPEARPGTVPNCWAYLGGHVEAVADTNRSARWLPAGWRSAWGWPGPASGSVSLASTGGVRQTQAVSLPGLRFHQAASCGRNSQGAELFVLEGVTQLEPLAKSRYRLILVPADGSARDLGTGSAEAFWQKRGACHLAQDGAWWLAAAGTLHRVSATGHVRQFPLAGADLAGLGIRASDVAGRIYFEEGGTLWRLDPAGTNLTVHEGVLVPSLSAMPLHPVWWDSFGRPWCEDPVQFRDLARFNHGRWERIRSGDDPDAAIRRVARACAGNNGAMLFQSEDADAIWLCDADGVVQARGLKELVLLHGDRFRRAIPRTPTYWTGDRFLKESGVLAADADGNVWMAEGRTGPGVWHSNRWLALEQGGREEGREEGGAPGISARLLCPVGDGHQVAWADGTGGGALLAVRSGRIQKLRDWPELAAATLEGPGGLRIDFEGRLWICRDEQSIGLRPDGDARKHPGYLVHIDRSHGYWFRQPSPGADRAVTLTRVDPAGGTASVTLKGAPVDSEWTGGPPLIGPRETPDGSLWVARFGQLIRLALRDGTWSQVEQHALERQRFMGLWCAADGKVWLQGEFGFSAYAVGSP